MIQKPHFPPRPFLACLMGLRVLLAGGVLPDATAQAQPVERGRMRVRSMLEMRQERVVKQGWDLSCGAAALSTLLTYDQGDPVGEGDIIQSMLRQADPKRIRSRHGFSLLDLKRFALARGYDAAGYGKLDAESLLPITPAIVPLSRGEWNHFVVVRGITGGHVLLADPAFGNRTMPVDRFEGLWDLRVAFVVRKKEPRAERSSEPGTDRAPVVPVRVLRHTIGGRP